MKRLDMSLARLSRESGISETTIRRIGQAEKRQRSTLVAISAALGYPYDYLVDVLLGEADPETPPQSPAETAFIKKLLRAEVDPLKVKVDVIDGKVDLLLLLDRQRNG
jgi:transcriptional regulator with XRE-family HTH domain